MGMGQLGGPMPGMMPGAPGMMPMVQSGMNASMMNQQQGMQGGSPGGQPGQGGQGQQGANVKAAGEEKVRRRVVIAFPPTVAKKVLGLEFVMGTTQIKKVTMSGAGAANFIY